MHVLHVSTVVLQALDVHSTLTALDAGAAEANPMMAGLVEHPVGYVALKAGLTAGVIYASHRLARRHPVRAFLITAAVNVAYAVVVAHNYRVLSGLK
jgi:hypothetical protein